MDIVNQEDLLLLLQKANFKRILFGVESLSKSNLESLSKKTTLRVNISDALDKIMSFGILPICSFILGLDYDLPEVFEQLEEEVEKMGVVVNFFNPLHIPSGTSMYKKALKENRITLPKLLFTGNLLNVIPRQMSQKDLVQGIYRLYKNLYEEKKFIKRLALFLQKSEQENKKSLKKHGLQAVAQRVLDDFSLEGRKRLQDLITKHQDSLSTITYCLTFYNQVQIALKDGAIIKRSRG
jgi:radical SAM superfamily enzyme YgiQ (UPF0313 family)